MLTMYDVRRDTLCRHCAGVASTNKTSGFEEEVAQMFDDAGIRYERHVKLWRLHRNVDFKLPEHDDLYVEARGYHHLKYRMEDDAVLEKAIRVVFVDSIEDAEMLIMELHNEA